MKEQPLRSGDVVEVKGPAEIIGTLDERGTLDGLPFMPEMLRYCGRQFVVSKRAEKVCIYQVSRRILGTVLLEDLRCDGSGHGGCQEECRLFWKKFWLRRVSLDQLPRASVEEEGTREVLAKLVAANTKREVGAEGPPEIRYVCQYTEILRASQGLAVWDPRVYLRELTTGNVAIGRFLRVTVRALFEETLLALGLMSRIPLKPTRSAPVADPALGLQPGDWVQVKTKEEIAATLNSRGKNRGLWFDREMLPHCGKTYRVRMRVSRLIDYETGKMVDLKSDCVKLEGAVCSGDLSTSRWFCPRGIFPYWRECWLRRVPSPPDKKG